MNLFTIESGYFLQKNIQRKHDKRIKQKKSSKINQELIINYKQNSVAGFTRNECRAALPQTGTDEFFTTIGAIAWRNFQFHIH